MGKLEPMNAMETDETARESHSKKIRTMFDDANDVRRGRQRELTALYDMGVITTAKRNSIDRQQMSKTRCVNRAKESSVKASFALKDFNHKGKRTKVGMSAPTPSSLCLRAKLARNSDTRTHHHDSGYSAIAMDVHAAFLHADIDRNVFCRTPRRNKSGRRRCLEA